MIGIGGGLVFAGYQLVAYGWSQLQSQNAGFFDLLWPGRYSGNTPDSGVTGVVVGANGGLDDVAAGGTIGMTPAQAKAFAASGA